ncbi:MAG: ABC-type transport auxiliary lipoprotein family protein, partial [Microvirga sp.]
MSSPLIDRACLLRRVAPVLVLAALTGACSSGPAPATYDLSAPMSRIRGASGVQVLVNEPAALQQLSTQQILVKDASGSVSFIGGGQWADNLPRLIQTRLINTFENASQLRGVSRPSSGAVADVQLISELRRFEIATPDNQAVAEIS